MRKIRSEKGYSLTEALLTVAIIIILASMVFVSVVYYFRSMTKLEYDAYAKEIFVAAQNHLSVSENQGYLGRTKFGAADNQTRSGTDTGVYFFVKTGDSGITGYSSVGDEASLLSLMLPFAAVDETVRLGGCYVIRYHKPTAQVLDVFYWNETSGRFKHTYVDDDYEQFMANRGDRDALMNYGLDKKSVIGYYGGENAQTLEQGKPLKAPLLTVTNANQLFATVTDLNRSTDPSADITNAKLKLIITGHTSGNRREIALTLNSVAANVTRSTNSSGNYVYHVILDDITQSGTHFQDLFCEDEPKLLAGEDVSIQAVAYNNDELTNIPYSTLLTTNSIFAYNTEDDGAAHIANIRHLENLDMKVSCFFFDTGRSPGLPYVTQLRSALAAYRVYAKQISDLSWEEFSDWAKTAGNSSSFYVWGAQTDGRLTNSGKYYPVTTEYILSYDGCSHSVEKIDTDMSDLSGMFGIVSIDPASGVSNAISNLKLVDFTITANGTGGAAGALAGQTAGVNVTNVLAISTDATGANIDVISAGCAGGLVGKSGNTIFTKCAAALRVQSTGDCAGGLVGNATSATVISGCYSGGHTEGAAYKSDKIDVQAASGNAGGLVGQSTNPIIEYSYSTCSVSGEVAGGLIGYASSSDASAISITSSYATGLVVGKTPGTTEGTFAGKFEGVVTLNGCLYYEIINERAVGTTYEYLGEFPALGEGTLTGTVSRLDDTPKTYQDFVGPETGWQDASAYDSSLIRYYNGKFNLRTVEQLGLTTVEATDFVKVHYGDWPAPEIFTVNEPE